MKKSFVYFFTGMIYFLAGSVLPVFSQETEETSVSIEDETATNGIEAEFGISTFIESDSGRTGEGASEWSHQLTDIDVEAYLTFSKEMTDSIGVYWGLYDWLNTTLNPDGSQSLLTNEITALVGLTYDPSESFSLFFDGGVVTAVNAAPEGSNYMYGGFGINLGFEVYGENVPIGFSFTEYFNPMMAYHTASDWYIYNVAETSFLYSFIDDLTESLSGGFFTDFFLESSVSFDGTSYFDDFVRADLFAGFDLAIPCSEEDIYPGFKTGLAYLYESGCESGSERETWRNDLGPLLGMYGQFRAFHAFVDFQPMLYTPESDSYLRLSLGMSIDL